MGIIRGITSRFISTPSSAGWESRIMVIKEAGRIFTVCGTPSAYTALKNAQGGYPAPCGAPAFKRVHGTPFSFRHRQVSAADSRGIPRSDRKAGNMYGDIFPRFEPVKEIRRPYEDD